MIGEQYPVHQVWILDNIEHWECDVCMFQLLEVGFLACTCLVTRTGPPVWKVCIVQPRSRLGSFDVPYIFYSKFPKSRARNLQTFQSGRSTVIFI